MIAAQRLESTTGTGRKNRNRKEVQKPEGSTETGK